MVLTLINKFIIFAKVHFFVKTTKFLDELWCYESILDTLLNINRQ